MTEHVKIYGVRPRIQYTADGTLATYEFPFVIFSASDIDVYFGSEKQDSSNYIVSGVRSSDGGAITFETAPTSGTIITIIRNLSIERATDFQEGGALRADTLNDELDYQIACQQQIAENLNRSMVLPPYAVDSGLDLTLPTPSAGKAIVWNSDGTNLENSTVAVNDLESTLNGYKIASETAATTATTQAQLASDKADAATNQADIATTKASEATTAADQLNGMRTNCITEIPQEIKLALSSGVLTLKSGSKCYLKTDTTIPSVSVSSDLTTTQTTDGIYFAIYNGSGLTTVLTTAYNYSTLPNTYSYPLGIVTVSNGAISSIDQVFNGFGYIGSTIFVLPGIKGLIPNGRNADGTLKNSPFLYTTIKTITSVSTGKRLLAFGSSNLYDIGLSSWFYNNRTNFFENGSGTTSLHLVGASFNTSSGVISNFTPKVSFQAVDDNSLTGEVLNTKGVRTITTTYKNGTDWYRIWSDGWIEQGGRVTTSTTQEVVVNLLKAFSNTNYMLLGTRITADTINGDTITLHPINTTTFGANSSYIEQRRTDLVSWYACGY